MAQAGFRVGWDGNSRSLMTVQGDVYAAELGSLLRGDFTVGPLPRPDTPGHVEIAGHNLMLSDRHNAVWGDRTSLIIGAKPEDNNDTGFEIQQNIRTSVNLSLGWQPTARALP
jgi:hypothetical protein